jgi:ABC-type dipeptide/oligopeptide/nickel transport system permease component
MVAFCILIYITSRAAYLTRFINSQMLKVILQTDTTFLHAKGTIENIIKQHMLRSKTKNHRFIKKS